MLLIAGDKVSILAVTIIEYDANFMNQFNMRAKELHDSALKWVHEDTAHNENCANCASRNTRLSKIY